MRLKKVMVGWLTGMALISAGCSQSSENSKGAAENKVVYAAPTELSTLDSSLVQDINAANYLGHLQEGLFWEDEKNEVHPSLAKELPEISKDGKLVKIKLREDAKWANGDKITAHDFVYAVQRLANPKTGASYSYLLENFENGPEILKGQKDYQTIGVKALDDYTIEIRLNRPTPYINHLLAFVSFYPLNKKFVEEKGDQYGTSAENVLASGPYQITEWDGSSNKWTLKKNPNFFAADKVKVETIEVQVMKEVSTNVNLFEAGKIDNAILTGETVKQFADHPKAVKREKARLSYLEFNRKKDYLNNAKLREAIDFAIDNKALTQQIIGDGSVATSTFLPKKFYFNPDTQKDFVDEVAVPEKADGNKAKELWEEAKKELGKDQLTIRLLADDDEKAKKECQYIQGQIQNHLPGVQVELVNVPKKNCLKQMKKQDFDLVLTEWGADYADASNFYDLYKTGNAYNSGDYSNAEYDAILAKAANEDALKPKERWEDFKKAQKILTDDHALVVLYQAAETQLRNPRLKGMIFRPVNLEFDFRTAYFE